MHKNFRIFALIFTVLIMSTCIAYSVEPDTAPPVSETIPAAQTLPTPMSTPTPSPISEPIPVPTAEPQPAVLPEEGLQPASDFSKELESIVMKRVNSFYKKGGSGTIGIYIKELKSGFEYSYNAEKTNPDNPAEGYFNSASTCKLLTAAVMYHLNCCGELELDKTYTDTVTKGKYNLKKILPRMISHSVNDYFNITLRHLGSQKINDELKELGLKNSIVYSEIMPAKYSSIKNNIKRYGISRSPRTTPKDLAYILELLYNEKTFGSENNKLFIEALKNNIYSNRLPAGINFRSVVAHKTGTSSGEGVYNDAGIIYLKDNPYIMVVMSKKSSSAVQPLFRTIAGEVYGAMKKRAELQPSIPQ